MRSQRKPRPDVGQQEQYVNHAIGLKRQVVELHVTHVLGSGDAIPLEVALTGLLNRTRLYLDE